MTVLRDPRFTRDGTRDVELLISFVILYASLRGGPPMSGKATVFWTTFAAALVAMAVKPIVQRFGVPA